MFYNESKGIVTKTTNLKSNIKSTDRSKSPEKSYACGGIFSDYELSWLYNSSILQVVNISDGAVISSWDFSTITRDSRTQINCVIEYPVTDHSRISAKESQICLIVSYTSKKDHKCSYISFCHPRTSRILHTITTKENVTCMSLLSAKKDHSNPISGLLKFMSGALAVGTQTGQLLIVDMKDIFAYVRRNSHDPYHNRFSEMTIMDLKRHSENEIKDKLTRVDHSSQHIAISLSDKKDSDTEICVLKYIPEGTMLAVGLRSGVFHLWDVNTLKKLYKSSSLEVPTPIAAFGFQEPCNDPQNFCYLWVLYEADKKLGSCLPFAVMYGILYKRVNSIPNFGRHYRNFVHCKKRFDLDVDLERCIGGRCISSSVVSNTPSNMLRHTAMNEEDPSKINLFVMVFETWERGADINSCVSLVVFDMNQWYKAQMPHQCYPGYSVPFVNFMQLERVSERKSSILDVCIKKDTIQQFLAFNLSEEYSYPSSLSFDTMFLSCEKIIHLRVPGAQRSVLEKIISDGPSGLMNPSKFYTQCKEAGLRPSFSEYNSNVIVPSQIQQRNYILTILLENKVSGYLVRCVKEWADGSLAISGCTLHHLIQWAWDCVIRIKQLTDLICVPLFDYSGDDLDRENYQKLKHCCQLIHIIRDLLSYIQKNYKQYLLDDSKLNHQKKTLQFVAKYFDVIIWCLDCGLLPEKVANSTDKCVPIYMMNIIQYTEQRREELKKIATNDKYYLIENCTLYIVDSILENESNGHKLLTQWQRESGGMMGLYPPVTLQSLLRMFLMTDLPTDVKHFIMIYFLLDVCDYHRDEEMKEQLLSFSIVFSIEPPFFSLVHACWYLDHEKFEEAADILMLDTVSTLLRSQSTLYKTILQACVCQKQYALALKLERLIQLSGFVFKDERFYITLLLQNGLVMEAYTTLKKTSFSQKKLLRHFFLVCDDFGLLKEIFKFPLTPEEEEEFMQYLDECTNKDAGDLKIMYLLSRARYVEAIDVNHNLGMVIPKFDVVGKDTLIQNSKSGRTTTRDLLVSAFSKTLPAVTNELITFCQKEKDKLYRFKEVTRPTPLSVIVRTDNTQEVPTYKSSFENVMQAAITKTAEIWKNVPTLYKNKRNYSLMKDTPFLRSDIMTPRKEVTNLFDRTTNISELCEDTEPPSKRIKRTGANMTYDMNEINETETHLSPSVEVTKILLTPHVQKRLNKLLQSTPESSPLTSILKSSEIPRTRQPQKVEFSIPEISKKTSRKILVDAEINVPTPLAEKLNDERSIQKPFGEDLELSPTPKRANLSRQMVSSPEKLRLSPVSLSPSNSVCMDSYYSLDSGSEELSSEECIRTKPSMPQSVIVETSSGKAIRHFVESMSEEESAAEDKKRIILEVMSEPESVEGEQNMNVSSVVASPVGEYDGNFLLHRESCITKQHASQNISVCQTESENVAVLSNEQEISVINPVPVEQLEPDASSFLTNECLAEVDSQYKSEENLSYVPLQPVVESSNENNTELMITPLTPWRNIYDECKSGSRYSNQFDDLDKDRSLDQNDQEFRSMENVPVVVEPKFSSYESEDVNEAADKCPADQDDSQSCTEITDTSNEDSDVEIVEENITQSVAGTLDEATTEENDDMSEKTYESDFLDSHGSLGDESTIAGSSVRDDDEINVNDFEEDLAEEYEEEEEKESVEENEDEPQAEDEDLEEEEEAGDEEDEAEEEEEAEIEEKNKEITNYDEKAFYENNPGIDFDELKRIVSNVAAAEAKAAESKGAMEATDAESEGATEAKAAESEGTTENEFKMPFITSSYSLSENEGSVSEIFNATPSMVEETIYIDYSDTSQAAKSFAEVSSNKITVSEGKERPMDVDTVESNESSVHENSKTDMSVEVLSLSSVPLEKESEGPPMVFYFGENSVASISEDVLGEEPHELDKSQSSSKEITFKEIPSTAVSTNFEMLNNKSQEPEQIQCSTPKIAEETFTFGAESVSAVSVNQTEMNASAEKNNTTPSSSVDIITVSTAVTLVSQSVAAESTNQGAEESIVLEASSSKVPESQYTSLPHVAESASPPCITDDVVVSEKELVSSSAHVAETGSQPTSTTAEKSVILESANPSLHCAMPPDAVSQNMTSKSSPHHVINEPETSELVSSPTKCFNTPEKMIPSSPDSPAKPEYSPLSNKSYRSSRGQSPSSSSSIQSSSSKVVERSQIKEIISPVAVEEEAVDRSVKLVEAAETDARILTPRRSLRVARRLSVDSIHDADNQSVTSNTSPARPPSRSTRRRSVDPLIQATDDDDAVSVRSGFSAAESVSSRASTLSTQSQKRKRSYSRLEMRKSTAAYQHKKLEVIVSDEEITSPAKSDVPPLKRSTRGRRVSSSAEPELEVPTSRRSARRRTESGMSEDDRLSSKSDISSKRSSRKSYGKSKLESETLNDAILRSPTPVKAKSRKLVCSTPVGKSEEMSKPSAAVVDYTSSRRLTRHQKSLLEYGIKRVEESEKNEDDRPVTSRILKDVPEENESFDSEEDFPEGSLLIDEQDAMQTVKLPKSQVTETKKSRKRATLLPEEPATSSGRRARYSEKPDDSTDDSISSKVSTSSRRSRGRPSTYTNLALRKSSVRRSLKPLAVIPSDEDSLPLSTPPKAGRNVDDELLISSPDSMHSKQSATKRITRSQRAESDQSDRESSVVSDATTVSTRQTRRSLMEDITKGIQTEKTEPSAGSSEEKAGTGSSTRSQRKKAEQTGKLSTRKKK